MSSQKSATFILLNMAIVIILLLTALNIEGYLSPKQVLGLETETGDREVIFWEDFLSKNPNYIPGWIELGRLDKVKQIDPNYPLP